MFNREYSDAASFVHPSRPHCHCVSHSDIVHGLFNSNRVLPLRVYSCPVVKTPLA